MTADDLARLRSLAEAATPGPWVQVPGESIVVTDEFDAPRVCATRLIGDATYIAALDPQTVLALLDAAALGLAWNRVEAALTEGWHVGELKNAPYRGAAENWLVMAWESSDDPDYRTFESAWGPTPTAALLALAEKLEARS